MATRELLQALLAKYREQTAHCVAAEADGGVKVASRVRAGEAVDIVVLAKSTIEELILEGQLLAGTRTDIARSGVAIAVPAGSPHLDVSSAEAVRQAVLAATSIGYSTGPSGKHLERVFERWGVMETVRNRITVAPAGVPVGTLIAKGAVQLGFQQLSELLGVDGVDILGPLPTDIQVVTTFSGAVSIKSRCPRDANEVLTYLASPIHADLRQRFGMQP